MKAQPLPSLLLRAFRYDTPLMQAGMRSVLRSVTEGADPPGVETMARSLRAPSRGPLGERWSRVPERCPDHASSGRADQEPLCLKP